MSVPVTLSDLERREDLTHNWFDLEGPNLTLVGGASFQGSVAPYFKGAGPSVPHIVLPPTCVHAQRMRNRNRTLDGDHLTIREEIVLQARPRSLAALD